MAAERLCADHLRSFILQDNYEHYLFIILYVKDALSENPNLKFIRLSARMLPYQVHFVVDNWRLTLTVLLQEGASCHALTSWSTVYI